MEHNHHNHDHNHGCCDNHNDNDHNEKDHNLNDNNHNHDHNHDEIKSDANDYSRFNDIDDSDDEIDKTTKSDDKKLPLEESLARAASLKDNGNDAIKAGDYNLAKEKYEQGIKLLDDHKTLSSDIVISTLSSLHLNNALACLKIGVYKGAIDSANIVLKNDKNNVKAIYRRGCAYLNQHSFDEAKQDLTKVLELEPENVAAKKELVMLVKLRKEWKEKEKSSFSGFLNDKNLYVDKEKERIRKDRIKQEEEEKQMDIWTQSKLERRKMGLEEQTFDEWKKEKEDLEKKDKEEQAKLEEERRKSEQPSPPKEIKKTPSVSKETTNDVELDEEDEKILKEAGNMKGYKIVNGKKTTFFNNELDQMTKSLIGDIEPKKLEQVVEAAPVVSSVVGSVWNKAGTFEEKEMSSFANDKIKEYVGKSEASDDGDNVIVTDVSKSEGEASIIVSRGIIQITSLFLYS